LRIALASAEHTSAPVSFESYPASAVAAAASLASGSLPAKHGIIGKAWSQNGALLLLAIAFRF
jgi:predicted AlkP superfamily pyrophosphatase or phosphodiesterase